MKAAVALSIAQMAKRAGDDVYDFLKGALGSGLTYSQAFLEAGFSAYLRTNIDRCDRVKTILSKRKTISLSKLYVDTILEIDKERIPEEALVCVDDLRRVVVTGTAGSGKSFLMKRLFLRYCESNHGRLPVLVELRHLNEFPASNVWNYILKSFEPHTANYSPSIIDALFGMGKVALLLDGFDELYSNVQEDVQRQIQDIAYRFPDIKIVVSGRPDQGFVSWDQFDEYSIAPFEKQQCLKAVKRTSFHTETKAKFIDAIEKTLWTTHQPYLENPLMISVMLMTFDQFVEIPANMGEFYAKAFETLYSGHDKTKSSAFRRDVKCRISLKELNNVLSYFCALSFVTQKFDYDEESAIEFLDEALNICQYKLNSEDLLADINKSYCLLIVDGTRFAYIHRSFQEYFTAVCLSRTEKIEYEEFNIEVIHKQDFVRYIYLLSEINRERLEKSLLIPVLDRYVNEVIPLSKSKPREFLAKHISGGQVFDDGRYHLIKNVSRNKAFSWFDIQHRLLPILYGDRVGGGLFSVIEDYDFLVSKKVSEPTVREVDDRRYIDFDVEDLSVSVIRKMAAYKFLVQFGVFAVTLLRELRLRFEGEAATTAQGPRYKRFIKGAG